MKMNQSVLAAIFFFLATTFVCAQSMAQTKKQQTLTEAKKPKVTTEDKEAQIAELKLDLSSTEQEIREATLKDEELAGGLVKSLIAVRLEILKTNRELIRQRIHAIESGARINLTLSAAKPDPARADELQKQIAEQRAKVADAQADSDKYSGGLVKAISESTVATSKQTLAMLVQQFLVAKYGLALPSTSQGAKTEAVAAESQLIPTKAAESQLIPTKAAESAPQSSAKKCIEIGEFDSSILERNSSFVELSWKADLKNTCSIPYQVRVSFIISDKDDFELDSDNETIIVPANDIGKARGRMLVSPPDKAARIAKQGVRISIR